MKSAKYVIDKYKKDLTDYEISKLEKEAESQDGVIDKNKSVSSYIETVFLSELEDEEKDIKQQAGIEE